MRRGSLTVGILILIAGTVLAGCSLLRTSPKVDFDASVTEGDAPLVVQFTPQVEGTAVSYAWSFGDGRTSDDPNPVHVYTHEGTYSVMLTVEFANAGPVARVKKRFVTVELALRKATPILLYWVSQETRRILRGDLAGHVSQGVANDYFPIDGIDVFGDRVYWVSTTASGGKIESGAVDGYNADRQVLLTEENRLGDVAIDTKKGKIYWTSLPEGGTRGGALKRANLDGSEVEVLVEYPAGSPAHAEQVVVDPEAGAVFWSLVGDGFEGVIRTSRTSSFDPWDVMRGVGRPRGMALDTAPGYGARNLYLTTGDELRRVKLYWPEMTTLATGLDTPAGVAVDFIGYQLYVGTEEGIVRAYTDGSGQEVIFGDLRQIDAVVLPR